MPDDPTQVPGPQSAAPLADLHPPYGRRRVSLRVLAAPARPGPSWATQRASAGE